MTIIGLIPVVVELIQQAAKIFKGAKRGAARKAWVKEHAQHLVREGVGGSDSTGKVFLDQLINQIHADLQALEGAEGVKGPGPALCCSACGGTHFVPLSERPPMITLTSFAKPTEVPVKGKKGKVK
jgi:hypothetical protein